MAEPKFAVSQTVYRVEDRQVTRAVVVQVEYIECTGYVYLIDYQEGGRGYWTEESLSVSPVAMS